MLSIYKLACGHKVATDVIISLQYPSDKHYVFCQYCKDRSPVAWQEIVGVLPHGYMYDVLSGIARIMPNDILRLQPTVPQHRIRPFPYAGARR